MSTADENLTKAADMLRSAQRVAVLTGAGISAGSGLATFRGAGGMWEGQRVEDVATPQNAGVYARRLLSLSTGHRAGTTGCG